MTPPGFSLAEWLIHKTGTLGSDSNDGKSGVGFQLICYGLPRNARRQDNQELGKALLRLDAQLQLQERDCRREESVAGPCGRPGAYGGRLVGLALAQL